MEARRASRAGRALAADILAEGPIDFSNKDVGVRQKLRSKVATMSQITKNTRAVKRAIAAGSTIAKLKPMQATIRVVAPVAKVAGKVLKFLGPVADAFIAFEIGYITSQRVMIKTADYGVYEKDGYRSYDRTYLHQGDVGDTVLNVLAGYIESSGDDKLKYIMDADLQILGRDHWFLSKEPYEKVFLNAVKAFSVFQQDVPPVSSEHIEWSVINH